MRGFRHILDLWVRSFSIAAAATRNPGPQRAKAATGLWMRAATCCRSPGLDGLSMSAPGSCRHVRETSQAVVRACLSHLHPVTEVQRSQLLVPRNHVCRSAAAAMHVLGLLWPDDANANQQSYAKLSFDKASREQLRYRRPRKQWRPHAGCHLQEDTILMQPARGGCANRHCFRIELALQEKIRLLFVAMKFPLLPALAARPKK